MSDHRHFPDQPPYAWGPDPVGHARYEHPNRTPASPYAPAPYPAGPYPAAGYPAAPHSAPVQSPAAWSSHPPHPAARPNTAPPGYASGPRPDYAAPHDHGRMTPPIMTPPTQAIPRAALPPQAHAPRAPAPMEPHLYAPEADAQAWDMPAQDNYTPAPHLSAPQAGYGAAPAWLGPRATAAPHAAARPSAHTPQRPARASVQPEALAHGFGAVLSLGLVVLAAVWTWQMMQRDVSGVPVVRALEGPMRVLPDDPGGTQAAFQGLAVNQLAGTGQVQEPEVIVLAPAPSGLGMNVPGANDIALATPDLDGPRLRFHNPSRLAVERSPRPRPREGSALLPGVVAQLAPAGPQITAPQAPSLSTSNDLRAGDALAASIAESVATGLGSPRGVDIDPASIGPGTRLVQLGAFDSPDEARGAWDVLKRRFSPLLDDRGRVIEAAHSGGSVFYRLRAHGFGDERDARRFCASLVAEQVDCIPVLVR